MAITREFLEGLNDDQLNKMIGNLDKIESINTSLAEKTAKKNPLVQIREEKKSEIDEVYNALSQIDPKELPSEYKKQLNDFHERNNELNEIDNEIRKLENEIQELEMNKDSIEIDKVDVLEDVPTVEVFKDDVESEVEIEKGPLKVDVESSVLANSNKESVIQAKDAFEKKQKLSDTNDVFITRRENKEETSLEEIKNKLLEEKQNIQDTINSEDFIDINDLISKNENSLKFTA